MEGLGRILAEPRIAWVALHEMRFTGAAETTQIRTCIWRRLLLWRNSQRRTQQESIRTSPLQSIDLCFCLGIGNRRPTKDSLRRAAHERAYQVLRQLLVALRLA